MSYHESSSENQISEEWDQIPATLKPSDRAVDGRVDELQLGLDRLNNFLDTLSPMECVSPIREDVLDHCDREGYSSTSA